MDRGEIRLNALLPLAVVLDVREVAVAGNFLAHGRHIVEVAFLHTGRELDGFERERLEVLLRHEPRLVRTVDAAGQEERLVVLAGELFADPLCYEPVAAELLIGDIEGGPVGFRVLPWALTREIQRALRRVESARERIVVRFRREVIVPALRVDDVVQQLARACGPIAVAREPARHQL